MRNLLIDLVLEVFLLQEVRVAIDKLLSVELNKLVDVDAIIFFDNLVFNSIILVFVEKELLESLTIVDAFLLANFLKLKVYNFSDLIVSARIIIA